MINPSLEHVVLVFLIWIELPVYGFAAKKASFLISQLDTAADVLVLLALLMQSEYCDLHRKSLEVDSVFRSPLVLFPPVEAHLAQFILMVTRERTPSHN